MALHEPVLVAEVLRFLAPGRGGDFVDCTIGAGGHTAALLAAGAGRVVGLDRDPAALAVARAALADWADRVSLVHADFRTLPAVLDTLGLDRVDGVLADLGVSSLQLDAEDRGFSFRTDALLDMRMDPTQGPTAADLLRDVPETTLADVIFRFGEERYSRRIARALVTERQRRPLRTTAQVASVVRRVVPRGRQRIDPATRTFQALRIWVNAELDGLDTFLASAIGRLRQGARLVVITFHSLEDRIVKHTLRSLQQAGETALTVLTRRPVRPGAEEVARNPRARSAKLRAAERLDA